MDAARKDEKNGELTESKGKLQMNPRGYVRGEDALNLSANVSTVARTGLGKVYGSSLFKK